MPKFNLYPELPSGVTLQEKINANMKGFKKQYLERIEAGEEQEVVLADTQARIRQNIKNLADKIDLVVHIIPSDTY